eukprot:TRINITY_DN1657_c1_g1_i1.p1 TRINITY_DN1657_c1_g1~~TRINITY_DN1657_c1_g1_i1.p1  ORF type:complete len:557 (-),score=127.14 TRINITY_DN1657_c1_g1_i1:66-1736(-)
MKTSLFFLLFGTLFFYVASQTASTAMEGLVVQGNRIYNGAGQEVRLRGVNRPGTEYSCVQFGKIFDGPADQPAIDEMRKWKINVVRVPVNEDCWNDFNNISTSLAGVNYQKAVIDWVTLLTKNSLAVIVDLHWASNTTDSSAYYTPMPSRATAPNTWISLANAFKSNSAVLFDIYNEPFPDSNAWDSDAAWNCWKNGGSCPGFSYVAAGMDELVAAVRSTGSTNIVMVGGIQFSTSLVRYLEYMPTDANMVAAVHVYDFNFCRSRGCWDTYWRPVFEKMPLLAGEMGETDCATDFIWDFMRYADDNGIGYLAWAWLPADCASSPSIISSFDGTPTNYGIGYDTHMNNLAEGITEAFYYTFPIFKDARTHWVDNWSPPNASLFLNETKIVHSGVYSIKFQAEYNNPLHFMCWDCFNTTLIRGINIWVHGGGSSSQSISINFIKIDDLKLVQPAKASSTIVYTVDLASLIPGGISPNTWKQAYVNMSLLPAGAYDGIQFASDTTQPWIYLDDITAYAVNDDGSDHSIPPNLGHDVVNSAFSLLPSCLIAAFAILVCML